eukprot:CAMPEP_0201520710 /NCGR_PEP_ID=MMETSP0161_2-20130828/12219_1 /ASSEMBLY_ACC=CAM_ASM_000251 /TAXON_ID=180227 /ORGANISM="Neoparamoeba aestuarina, Strain SoJaBio B1-5/56/2" /LENGTH=128 /DNA_ID=CAMNT_0047919179 /DNA_START=38 /DNA_END=424 /DNA_ORIENTATION=+
MCCQDPSVIFNIAKKHSAFRLKRNGIIRSIDKLNASGEFTREDGIFASAKTTPISFEPVTVDGKQTTMGHVRDSKGMMQTFLVHRKNANTYSEKVKSRQNCGSMGCVHAARAKKVIRSTTRALKKSRA